MIKGKSSFRDDSGYIFYQDDRVFRAVNNNYSEEFNQLVNSGLYRKLVSENKLIEHSEKDDSSGLSVYKVLEVKKVPFISYPYEWCFSQLKQAALVTLEIQQEALKHDMILKDASAFNVQFINNRPTFIDTLSFDIYRNGQAWVAYRQFCQHFLNPLMLIHYSGESFAKFSINYLDGIPVSTAANLLSRKAYFNLTAFLNVFMHSKLEKKALKNVDLRESSAVIKPISKDRLLKINEFLMGGIEKMNLKIEKSTWSNYVKENNYEDASLLHKKSLVDTWVSKIRPSTTWDVGCNTGIFSEIAANHSGNVIAADNDYQCINLLYEDIKKKNIRNIHPVCLDVLNPTPAIGWNNHERKSFLERINSDLILALAVIHHLRITGGVPLTMIAKLFQEKCKYLVVEFVEKTDSQVKRMLSNRKDIFDDYTIDTFKNIFSEYFTIIEEHPLPNSNRWLFLMQKISS